MIGKSLQSRALYRCQPPDPPRSAVALAGYSWRMRLRCERMARSPDFSARSVRRACDLRRIERDQIDIIFLPPTGITALAMALRAARQRRRGLRREDQRVLITAISIGRKRRSNRRRRPVLVSGVVRRLEAERFGEERFNFEIDALAFCCERRGYVDFT